MTTQTYTGVTVANRMLVLLSAPLVASVQDTNGTTLEPVKPLAVQEEIDAIVGACRYPHLSIEFRIEVAIATVDVLRHIAAAGNQPLIIHFSGHGMRADEQVALVLETDVGLARPLHVDELRALLRASRYPPCKVAILNAYHTHALADALLDAGVKHIVAINAEDAVLDVAARAFARHFYPALLSGREILGAFHDARSAVITDSALVGMIDKKTYLPVNWGDAVTFHLLPRPGRKHLQSLELEPIRGEVLWPQWKQTNIPPISRDRFVGRRLDVYSVTSYLRDLQPPRCLLIKGIGGMGKTALAQAAGRWQHERHRWHDGVWLFELGSISEVEHVTIKIASMLGLGKVVESVETLRNALMGWHSLFILDDLDRLLHHDPVGTISLLHSLLDCQHLRLLVTAREDLPGEIGAYEKYNLERMDESDSLATFHYYAGDEDEWKSADTQEQDLRAVMSFLDGYPFPIRLAATYMRQKPCSLHTLWESLRANPQGTLRYPYDKEDRKTSLAATLDLSYHALPSDAQDIFPLLALFPAGITDDAAIAILGKESVSSLETLLHFSMAERRYDGLMQRFALPEPARKYAEGRQRENAIDRYALAALDFFHSFVQRANVFLSTEKVQTGQLLLTIEQPNLRRFLEWGYDYEQSDNGISRSARLTALLATYWLSIAPSQSKEALDSLNRALVVATRIKDQEAEAGVYEAIGALHVSRNDPEAALQSYVRAAQLYKQVQDQCAEAALQVLMGDLLVFRNRQNEALRSYQRALELYHLLNNWRAEARVQKRVGTLHVWRNDPEAALQSYVRAAQLYKQVQDQRVKGEVNEEISEEQRSEAEVYELIGNLLVSRNRQNEALRSYQRALELYRQLQDHFAEAHIQELLDQLSTPLVARNSSELEGDELELHGRVALGIEHGNQSQAAEPAPGSNIPIRILFLAANPLDTDQLRLSEEVRTIDERLRSSQYRERFELIQHWAIRRADLAEYLLRHSPDIVHFSGHGNDQGQIILEDRAGSANSVSPQALGRMFRTLKENVRCVVLNACFSATQAHAIAQEIDCVVGMSHAVGDDAAIQFASGFYQALGYGRSVQTAFDNGCNQIDLEALGEEVMPQLLVKPGVDPNSLTFVPRFSRENAHDSDRPNAQSPIILTTVSKRQLRLKMVHAFSLEELGNLCADLEEELAQQNITLHVDLDMLAGSGKEAKVRELIDFMDRRGHFAILVRAVRNARPGII